MVGSVLMQRMNEERDFDLIEPLFFSTSQVGECAPEISRNSTLLDADSLEDLADCEVIVSCQGGDYTKLIYPELRKCWNGYWIDAASVLRMNEESVIVLDPVNSDLIKNEIDKGTKTFVGGNCTVSLMLMALDGLVREGVIDWVSSMTYQAASGAGAKYMLELIEGMGAIHDHVKDMVSADILEIDRRVTNFIRGESMPRKLFDVPLAASLIPWIDSDLGDGRSREEWKGDVEANKILAGHIGEQFKIDGLCVRIGAMRCHSQALTIKLKRNISLGVVNQMLAEGNQWAKLIPNDREMSIQGLTPAVVSGGLSIPIGRVRKLNFGPEYVSAFTCGDQLLWGAAEPLRRMLLILLGKL